MRQAIFDSKMGGLKSTVKSDALGRLKDLITINNSAEQVVSKYTAPS